MWSHNYFAGSLFLGRIVYAGKRPYACATQLASKVVPNHPHLAYSVAKQPLLYIFPGPAAYAHRLP